VRGYIYGVSICVHIVRIQKKRGGILLIFIWRSVGCKNTYTNRMPWKGGGGG